MRREIIRNTLKTMVFSVCGNGPLLRRRLNIVRAKNLSVILNLHRVAPDDGSAYRPLAPELFDELLSFVKREFSIVLLGEVDEKSRKPKLVLSFDDGYKDFITYALPALRRHRIRVNQNVIPRCIESGLPPINVLAQDFIGKAPMSLLEKIEVPNFDTPIGRNSGEILSRFLKFRKQAEQDKIAEILIPQFLRWEEFKPTQMMNLNEIRSLHDCQLGAHSFAHSSMEYETDEFLDADVNACRKYFDESIGTPMTIYAFPNGSCREGQAERVLLAGVKHVLLVGDRFDKDHGIHNRFTFDGSSASEIRFKALGGMTRT